MSSPKRSFMLLALLSIILAVTLIVRGTCNRRPTVVPVSGQVLIDGQPLTSGFVRVIPHGARSAVGEINSEGRFKLTTFDNQDGCVLGKHPVEIISRDVLSPTKIRWLTPKKYSQTATSELTITVDGPTDSLRIELAWDGGAPFIEETEGEGDVPVAEP
jgi:hypothetical protein